MSIVATVKPRPLTPLVALYPWLLSHLYLFSPPFLSLLMFLLRPLCPKGTEALDGWTAMMYASYKGHLAVAKMLVVHGADLEARDNKVSSKTKDREEG